MSNRCTFMLMLLEVYDLVFAHRSHEYKLNRFRPNSKLKCHTYLIIDYTAIPVKVVFY